MSRVERLQVLETVWDLLLEDVNEMKSPDWHEEILSERKRKIEEGTAKVISLDELKAQRK